MKNIFFIITLFLSTTALGYEEFLAKLRQAELKKEQAIEACSDQWLFDMIRKKHSPETCTQELEQCLCAIYGDYEEGKQSVRENLPNMAASLKERVTAIENMPAEQRELIHAVLLLKVKGNALAAQAEKQQ